MRKRTKMIAAAAAMACAASVTGAAAIASAAGPAAPTARLAASASAVRTSPAATVQKVAFAVGPVTGANVLVLEIANGGGARSRVQVRSVPASASPPGKDIWISSANHNGTFTLRASYNTKLCLDVPGSNYRKGTGLDVRNCTGTANQQFLITQDPFMLVSPLRGQSLTVDAIRPYGADGKCLAVSGGLGSGHRVVENPCNSGATQTWVPVYAAPSPAAARFLR